MSEVKPLVAIHCLVYNHAPYLRDCLEGFVMQQTNFPFVAVVHDDASTDNSAAIIREYEQKYPHIFKPIYETESIYKKGGFGAIDNVMLHAINATNAKYVAMCEGDDYWTNPLKLQKQVDFMEANPDYVICSHKFKKRYMIDGHVEDIGYSSIFPEKSEEGCTFFLEQIYEKFYLQTLCVLYRRSALNEERYLAHHQIRDNVLFLEIMRNGGKGYIFNSYDGVYRIHDGGVYSGLGKEKSLIEAINLFEYIYRVFPANFTKVKLFYQYSNYISFLQLHYPWYKSVLDKRFFFYLRKRFYLIHGSLFKYAKRKLKIVLKK